jgi:hypothetical protein
MIGQATSRTKLGDEQIRAATGKGWEEWVALLDEWTGHPRDFRTISEYLIPVQRVNRVWAQVIAAYYCLDRIASK